MQDKSIWENTYAYRRILQILSDYWLTNPDESKVRVEMWFLKEDGQRQEKVVYWENPNHFKYKRNKPMCEEGFSRGTVRLAKDDSDKEVLKYYRKEKEKFYGDGCLYDN